jgi:transposase
MVKEEKLINKFKRLLRRLGMPRWLHHFGPKKYELANHLLALVLKQECKQGYRRISRMLRGLGIKCATKSGLWYAMNRIPLALWQRVLSATADKTSYILAIDGTGMSRTNASPYYYWRIDKPYPVEIPLKLSIVIDTKTKKIVALRLRATKAHDIKDAKYLLKRSPQAKWLVADKGYDANWLHHYCDDLGMTAVIPMRKKGKSRNKNHTLRRRNQQFMNYKRYHRRSIVESIFKAIKTKFGASIASHKISAQRAEAYCRAIAHNIILFFKEILDASEKNAVLFMKDNLTNY